jgi:hypothetical protein
MRQVDDYFCHSIERTLYHYSGIGSLMGIAETNNIWASNAYYMNDSKEITHACDVLENVLKPKMVFGNDTDPEYIFLKQFLEWLKSFRNVTYNIFVFSLSEQPSLLSQWRSYTPHGKGISIGFSKETINEIIQTKSLRAAKCLYEMHEKEEAMASLVDKLLTTFRQEVGTIDTSKAHPTQSYHPFLEGFRGDILQVLSIIKHETFQEKQEWRLVSKYYPKYTVPDIKFREGASMLIPYIELPLGVSKPYFTEVRLGPSYHENLSMSALSMFLSNKGLCDSTVNSGIPYREW